MFNNLIKPEEVVGGGIMRAAPQSSAMDMQLIATHIAGAERGRVKPILQEALFADMVLQQNTAKSNYNPALGTLVPKFPTMPAYEALWKTYLLELECLSVLIEALPFIAAQIGANGVMIPSGINSQPADYRIVKSQMDSLERRIAALQCDVKDYLETNFADFPLYVPERQKCGCLKSKCKCPTTKLGVLFY